MLRFCFIIIIQSEHIILVVLIIFYCNRNDFVFCFFRNRKPFVRSDFNIDSAYVYEISVKLHIFRKRISDELYDKIIHTVNCSTWYTAILFNKLLSSYHIGFFYRSNRMTVKRFIWRRFIGLYKYSWAIFNFIFECSSVFVTAIVDKTTLAKDVRVKIHKFIIL